MKVMTSHDLVQRSMSDALTWHGSTWGKVSCTIPNCADRTRTWVYKSFAKLECQKTPLRSFFQDFFCAETGCCSRWISAVPNPPFGLGCIKEHSIHGLHAPFLSQGYEKKKRKQRFCDRIAWNMRNIYTCKIVCFTGFTEFFKVLIW